MKYIFFGTPQFAATILEKLIAAGYIPTAVVCASDKPVGRKQALTPPHVKEAALRHEILVFQPASMKEENFLAALKNIQPDLFILAAYGKILPKKVLDIPKKGTLNIHPSLLPRWRGASPIQAAILTGDKEMGATIMLMDEEMDHGPILAQKKLAPIEAKKSEIKNKKWAYPELAATLATTGAELLIEVLPQWIAGTIKPQEQKHEKATYCPVIKKEDGKIDWSNSAEEIERMVRAFVLWPKAYTFWETKTGKKKISIIDASITAMADLKKLTPGSVFLADKKTPAFARQEPASAGQESTSAGRWPAVQCGSDALLVKTLQLEGKKQTSAQEFLNGHREFIGNVFQ